MKLARTVDAWAKCDPKAMSTMSRAAIMYALQDAKQDVAALATQRDEVATALGAAVARLQDMLQGDDGQAWKEAERALPGLLATLAKVQP